MVACTSSDDGWWDSTIDINPHLPIDNNGYYHLKLDKNSKRTVHTLEGHLIDSPNMLNKPIEFQLTSNGNKVSILEPETHPRQQKFETTILPYVDMVNDTLLLRSRVYLGIDASGDVRYATNFTKIILD